MSRDILLNLIDRDPSQPRQHFDETALNELAQSIAANGLAVPILVRPVGERFVIVHGERRFRAATSLGWASIPAEVKEIDVDTASWLALVENIQRADLSPIEEAKAYQQRLSQGMTQTELGQRIGKTQSYIATKLRLLKLSPHARSAVHFGRISEGHAKQLLRIDSPIAQTIFTSVIVRKGLSVSQVNENITALLADAPLEVKGLDEAWSFMQELFQAPDNSELVRKYGRFSPLGWTPGELPMEFSEWQRVVEMVTAVSCIFDYANGLFIFSGWQKDDHAQPNVA